jgi:hypothetical protein
MASAIWLKTDMVPSAIPWVKPRVKAAGLLRSDQTDCNGPGSLSMMVDWKAGATEAAAALSAWVSRGARASREGAYGLTNTMHARD